MLKEGPVVIRLGIQMYVYNVNTEWSCCICRFEVPHKMVSALVLHGGDLFNIFS